jgi:murein DD-endopeptidase MepM/ murein hydrolase activator NlpD
MSRVLPFCLGLLLAWPAAAADPIPCLQGVEIRLSSAAPVQGGLVLVEVEGPAALRNLKAAWVGQQLQFWRKANPSNTHRALVGVDLAQDIGVFPLTLSAELEGGGRLACSALVAVEDGQFAVERLKVGRRFVELSKKDRERARRETRRLLDIFARVTPERLWAGGFQLPLEDIEASGNFGKRRILNNQPRSPHSGEDFPAPAGTPVRAAQRGRVALADILFFSGNTVVVDHGLGLYSFYGHLQSMAVKEGQVVEAGTALGRVGATGRVTGAHLHWAVRLNRQRVNPLDLPAVLSD